MKKILDSIPAGRYGVATSGAKTYGNRYLTLSLKFVSPQNKKIVRFYFCFRMSWDIGLCKFAVRPMVAKGEEIISRSISALIRVPDYQPIEKREVRAFLRRLLVTPDNLIHHIRQ